MKTSFLCRVVLAGCLWGLGSACGAPARPSVEEVSDHVLELAREQAFGGVAFALVTPSDRLFKTYGEGPAGGVLTADAPLDFSPLREPLESLLVATLVSEGVLDWDLPARRAMPAFRMAAEGHTREVSVRQLLGMTAGVPEHAAQRFPEGAWRSEDLWRILAQVPPVELPGGKPRPSRLSTLAGALVAARAVGAPRPVRGVEDPAGAQLAGLLQERLFVPLGMTSARVPDAALLEGFEASLVDVVAWLRCEISGGRLAGSGVLCRRDLLEERWRAVRGGDAELRGLGWVYHVYRGTPVLARGGATREGGSCLAGFLPREGVAFALWVSAPPEEAAALLEELPLALVEVLVPLGSESTEFSEPESSDAGPAPRRLSD